MAQQAATAPLPPESGPAEAAAPPLYERRQHPRHCYGALDLGTNNCRLLIARPAEEGFVVIDAFSRVVRLGEGLATSGKISLDAQDRAVAALAVCAEKLCRRRVTLSRSVATEACRRAVNGRQFVERVRRETGILLEIIAPEEEARLAMLGCHRLLEPGEGPALIFDIGGGSTELVLVDTDGDSIPKIKCWWSAPWGVVSLTESEGRDFADASERLAAYGRMKERVRHAFRHFSELLPPGRDNIRLLGTSGTVTTLASVHLALPSYDRRAVDGLLMPAESMRAVNAMLSHMSIEERAQLPCIGSDRADLVVAGCAILEAIMDIWPAKTLGVADRGIREGILRSLMAKDGHKL
ncbi:MAG: exopolyphosphatase / guanosine-5-triphosphate,3-diphosphate pyrophosphatase [Sphingomonadales bacterium]|jgi:exopolyphosphatase/guanosine-5'-triphosphate,3'-diphosphate pyrophosphatase|nr:exopolyphosphatase / guanosine-5-triphosphate,3-diphosphate pyrophosphatase [Sphingomonadales bacterium]